MKCPGCGNTDEGLIEYDPILAHWFCAVCSKTWREQSVAVGSTGSATIMALMLWLVLLGTALGQTSPCAGTDPTGTVYNPVTLCFAASPDHATTCPSTTAACVDHYTVEHWLQASVNATDCSPVQTGGQPVTTLTLARAKIQGPATGSTKLWAPLADLTPIWAIPVGQTYVTCMRAWNDTNISSVRSGSSNPFASALVVRPPAAVSVR